MLREMPGIMMVKDVGARDEAASDWPVFASIGVFQPMKKAGQEISYQNRGDYFQNKHLSSVSNPGRTTCASARRSSPNAA